ncbi:MAG: hypothetical protein AB1641_01035 [Thermodesulfobacteriota bacterium]
MRLFKPDWSYIYKRRLDSGRAVLFALALVLMAPLSSRAMEGDCLRGDCQQGIGVMIFSYGLKYEGQFKDGLFHGLGVLTLPDGGTKTGEFRNGEFMWVLTSITPREIGRIREAGQSLSLEPVSAPEKEKPGPEKKETAKPAVSPAPAEGSKAGPPKPEVEKARKTGDYLLKGVRALDDLYDLKNKANP